MHEPDEFDQYDFKNTEKFAIFNINNVAVATESEWRRLKQLELVKCEIYSASSH